MARFFAWHESLAALSACFLFFLTFRLDYIFTKLLSLRISRLRRDLDAFLRSR